VAAVEVRNLRKTYGHIVAVDDLSSTIDYGGFRAAGPERSGQEHRRALARIRLPLVVVYTLWPTERPAEAPGGGD
jgi:hypothetical protein